MLKELCLSKSELGEPENGFLGSWFANLFRLERRKCVLFTNDRTLYSVLLYSLRKADFDNLGKRFVAGLTANLQRDGFPAETIASIGMACHPVAWGATNDRSVLGSMNDMVSCSRYMVALRRQEPELEVAHLNHELNRTPMSALKLVVAIEEMRAALKEWSP